MRYIYGVRGDGVRVAIELTSACVMQGSLKEDDPVYVTVHTPALKKPVRLYNPLVTENWATPETWVVEGEEC